MRYLLIPILILATSKSSFSQVYQVVPRDLGNGYMIADGGSITVVDDMIAEWTIPITGEFPHTFTNSTSDLLENSFVVGVGMFEISPEAITFDMTQTHFPSSSTFESGPGDAIASCPQGLQCVAEISWASGDAFFGAPFSQVAYLFWVAPQNVEFPRCGDLGDDLADDWFSSCAFLEVEPTGAYVVATVVPEPSGFCLGLVGLSLVGAWRKRKRRTTNDESVAYSLSGAPPTRAYRSIPVAKVDAAVAPKECAELHDVI